MRRETLTESKESVLVLAEAEAQAIIEAGRRLASTREWWGDTEPPVDRSVIQCARIGERDWRVKVIDAVGLVSVGDLQIEVRPKIPLPHLLYLFGLSGQFPRLDEQRAEAAVGMSLWELIAKWFLGEVELVLRRDLVRGYHETGDDLKLIRGRVMPLATARAFYVGRLEFTCEYEEFNTDTPLNRMLRGASRSVGASNPLDWADRRRALSALARMPDVTELQAGDLRAQPGRTTAHYTDAIALARHILQSQGREPVHGRTYARTFLIRTPEMIEEGLRNLLQQTLENRWAVEKRGRQIEGSTMTFNPDLVFGAGTAVGDVKYKLTGSDWRRGDLYQTIAFATAFQATHGAVIGFQRPRTPQPPRVLVGHLLVDHLSWPANDQLSAFDAGEALCNRVQGWLNGLEPTVGRYR